MNYALKMEFFRPVLLACPLLFCLGPTTAEAIQVNAILENLFTEMEVPGTTVTTNDDIVNGNWSFSETNMNGLSVGFNNNRHEFFFSEDGSTPITVDGDTSWSVAFDIRLDATLVSPRKAFNFVVFNGPNSTVNLTTNRSPAGAAADSDPPGESAMFGGQYNFVRLIGPADGDPGLNLNPSVGYTAGDTVRLEIHHVASPDGGVTPSTVEHTYDDGTGPYTTGPRELRNTGIFADGAQLGFIMQGIAHSGTATDSYGATITNFSAVIGALPGDYNNDGMVDSGDYALARNNLGGSESVLATGTRDPSLAGQVIGSGDISFWIDNFGAPEPAASTSSAPEPTAAWLALISISFWRNSRRGR